MIKALTNPTTHKLYDIYYVGDKFPTLADCAGKAIILTDKKKDQRWAKKEEWKELKFIHEWQDKNYNAKKDAVEYAPEERKQRLNDWKDAVKKTMNKGRKQVADGITFYRNGINANSKSSNWFAIEGTPLQWAQEMNPKVLEYINKNSFTFNNKKKKICQPCFYGAINVDLPKKNDPKIKAKEIAKAVIESNCGITFSSTTTSSPAAAKSAGAHLINVGGDELDQYLYDIYNDDDVYDDGIYDDDEYDDDEYDDYTDALIKRLSEYLFETI